CCARAREVHTLECRSSADGHQGHSGSTEEIMGAKMTAATAPHPKPFYRHLYVQVLTAIVIGVLLGHFYPDLGTQMKPLGDIFIKLIKMLIAPIIFCTVVHGIASMEDMKKV